METRHQKSESEMMSKILQSGLVWGERKESKPTALIAQAENCGAKGGWVIADNPELPSTTLRISESLPR